MNELAVDLWREVRETLRGEGPRRAGSWLEQLRPRSFRRGVFEFAVPNETVRLWLEQSHRGAIERVIRAQTGSPVRVRLVVDPTFRPRALGRRARGKIGGAKGAAASPPYVPVPEAKPALELLERTLSDPLSGNPLFLHGDAGVGKSALVAHALARILDPREPRRVARITAEEFTHGFVRALREGGLPIFRGRLLASEVFVCEEIHRLGGRAACQQEFVRILLYHLDRRRPVVLTSRHAPHEIRLLEERLRSHLLGGLVVRLPDPGDPSRKAILAAHAARAPVPVPEETLDRIVRRVPGTVGRQVNFLGEVVAWVLRHGGGATLEELSEPFPVLAGRGEGEIDFRALLAQVAAEFGAPVEEVASNKKARRAALARHVTLYLAVEVLGIPARRALRSLGNLAPSTASYARRRVAGLRRDDPAFDHRLRRLIGRLREGQRLLF